jgi:hypothetical protein
MKDVKTKRSSSSYKKFDRVPSWVDPVLHGLSYWIGHQR